MQGGLPPSILIMPSLAGGPPGPPPLRSLFIIILTKGGRGQLGSGFFFPRTSVVSTVSNQMLSGLPGWLSLTCFLWMVTSESGIKPWPMGGPWLAGTGAVAWAILIIGVGLGATIGPGFTRMGAMAGLEQRE